MYRELVLENSNVKAIGYHAKYIDSDNKRPSLSNLHINLYAIILRCFRNTNLTS